MHRWLLPFRKSRSGTGFADGHRQDGRQCEQGVWRGRCRGIRNWTVNSRGHSLTLVTSCAKGSLRSSFPESVAKPTGARAVACPHPADGFNIRDSRTTSQGNADSGKNGLPDRAVTCSNRKNRCCRKSRCRRRTCRRSQMNRRSRRSRTNPHSPMTMSRTCPKKCRWNPNSDPHRAVHNRQKPRPVPRSAARPWMYGGEPSLLFLSHKMDSAWYLTISVVISSSRCGTNA